MKGFPGLLNTLRRLIGRSQAILQFFKILKNTRDLVHVCGYFWVQSLCLLGAKYAEVGCNVYGYFWVHVYAFWVHECGF